MYITIYFCAACLHEIKELYASMLQVEPATFMTHYVIKAARCMQVTGRPEVFDQFLLQGVCKYFLQHPCKIVPAARGL